MADKLKIRLYRVKNGCEVFGWVEHQDESLRAKPGVTLTLSKIPDGRAIGRIESQVRPGLGAGILWVRGERMDNDRRVFQCRFASTTHAIEACEDIKRLVAKVNETTARDRWLKLKPRLCSFWTADKEWQTLLRDMDRFFASDEQPQVNAPADEQHEAEVVRVL